MAPRGGFTSGLSGLDTPLRRWAPEDGRIDLSDGELRCSLFPNAPKPQMQLRDVETRYWLTLEPAVDSLLPWKRKPARIKAERANGEGEPRWQPLALDDAHLQTLWNHWLPLIGQTERLRSHIEERITPARIAHLLALPYTLWMAQRVLDCLQALPPEQRESVEQWVRAQGGERLLELQLPRLQLAGLRVIANG